MTKAAYLAAGFLQTEKKYHNYDKTINYQSLL
jgi:hypothetical protein